MQCQTKEAEDHQFDSAHAVLSRLQAYQVPFSDSTSVYFAELWSPVTKTFTVLAPAATPRNYHSVAVRRGSLCHHRERAPRGVHHRFRAAASPLARRRQCLVKSFLTLPQAVTALLLCGHAASDAASTFRQTPAFIRLAKHAAPSDLRLLPIIYLLSTLAGHFRTDADSHPDLHPKPAQILLPDARIFTGGGGLCGTTCPTDGANHDDGEIFSPPYLFDADGSLATRPVISSAPPTATYGATLMVTTDTPVGAFSLIRAGCAVDAQLGLVRDQLVLENCARACFSTSASKETVLSALHPDLVPPALGGLPCA